MRPPSLHTKFFSSLKQVEKRLDSEVVKNKKKPSITLNPPPSIHQQQQHPSTASSDDNDLSSPLYLFPQVKNKKKPSITLNPPSIHQQQQHPSTASSDDNDLSSPLYLFPQEPNNSNTQTLEDTTATDSLPPQEFLSFCSQQNVRQVDQTTTVEDEDEEIEQLMQLVGSLEMNKEGRHFSGGGDDDEFKSKVLGMKGPKNDKEMERLDGWIQYYMSNNEMEPLRLAHLLLCKAAVVNYDEETESRFEFPSTVDDYLNHDPPPT